MLLRALLSVCLGALVLASAPEAGGEEICALQLQKRADGAFRSSSSRDEIETQQSCHECGYVPNANIGFTGKETVTVVGTDVGAGQKCCDECKAKAGDDPPCAAWVYIHDGHCYQKYDTGIAVEMTDSPDKSGSDAGILKAPMCKDCGYVPNANIGSTGKETVTVVGTDVGAGQKCCDECKAKAGDDPPCAAWVYIHDGHCYQKYDTGIPIEMTDSPDKSGSDAGILKAAPTCKDCGYVPNANIGWTGKETVTVVGTDVGAGQKCCDECKAKAGDDPPCAAWVYIHDGHCYQKYDTGIAVEMTDSPDKSGSDAGILKVAPACKDCGYVPNANIGWTGKETVTVVGTDVGAGQKCCDECKAKAGDDPPCAAWVYIHDGHCYQKYDTGIAVEMTDSPDKSGSDAGILK